MLTRNAFTYIRGAAILLLLLTASVTSAQTKLLRFPDIHGDRVAFTYGGDIWTAPSKGGEATRVTAHFVFAHAPSGTSSSHSLRTEDARLIVEPTTTTRLCRRATRCSRSAFGFGTLRRSMPSSTWARTARSNGSLARPSR